MAVIGQVQEYRPETENVSSYLEHMELLITANGVAKDKRIPLFLSLVGVTMYALLCDLLAQEKPQAKLISELFETL